MSEKEINLKQGKVFRILSTGRFSGLITQISNELKTSTHWRRDFHSFSLRILVCKGIITTTLFILTFFFLTRNCKAQYSYVMAAKTVTIGELIYHIIWNIVSIVL
jgi:hypothetical protein